MEAMGEKKYVLESHFQDLKAKYGVSEDKSEDVIVVDATPSPRPSKKSSTTVKASVLVKGTPGKYTKEALLAGKKRKHMEEKDDPDFEVSPPPSKKKLSLQRKRMVITVEGSDESQEEEPESPVPKKSKSKGKGKSVPMKSKKRPSPKPEKSDDDSDSAAPSLKRGGRRRSTPRKATPAKTGRHPAVPWCSSSSYEGGGGQLESPTRWMSEMPSRTHLRQKTCEYNTFIFKMSAPI